MRSVPLHMVGDVLSMVGLKCEIHIDLGTLLYSLQGILFIIYYAAIGKPLIS